MSRSTHETATPALSTPSSDPGAEHAPRIGAGRNRPRFTDYSGLLIWAALIVLFAILVPSTFLTMETLRATASGQAITGIMALALVFPLCANTYDLSIGSVMGFAVIFLAKLMSSADMAMGPALIVTLAAGVLIGAINGLVVVKFRVNSFIATLGSSTILIGLFTWICGDEEIVSGISNNFTNLTNHTIFTIGIPFWCLIVLGAVVGYVLRYRQVGRYLYATGSNPAAARLSGVRTDRIVFMSLIASSTIATFAGIVFLSTIGSAPVDAGSSYLLPAFAAVFLGATQFRARRINVIGTIIAVYLLATGVKGLQLEGANLWVDDVFNGAALIIAVAFAARAGRMKKIG